MISSVMIKGEQDNKTENMQDKNARYEYLNNISKINTRNSINFIDLTIKMISTGIKVYRRYTQTDTIINKNQYIFTIKK